MLPVTAQSVLNPRSSGAPTAGHQALSGGTQYIFASQGLASCRCRPFSLYVRPRQNPSCLDTLLSFAGSVP